MIKLYSLENGKEFRYGGISWIKLSENEDGEILAITKELIEDRAFDEEGSNNWQESSLRKYLNDTFLNRLIKEGANKKDFLKITQSLRADDGTDEYGKTTDLISLLTDEQYRYYRNLLPKVDNWYWLITPYSCDPSFSYIVRLVSASGLLSSGHACNGNNGVRPLCNLKSEILVEVDQKYEEEKQAEEDCKTLTEKIQDWARDRGLDEADPKAQMLKLVEELGELAEGMAKNRRSQIEDSIGDVYVVLTILSMQLGLEIKDCVTAAYEEIKDRKGRIVNGVYVKEEDL